MAKTKKNKKSKQKPNFNKEAVYVKEVYQPAAFKMIQDHCDTIRDMVPDPKAKGRLMHIFDTVDPFVDSIYNEDLVNAVRSATGNNRLDRCTSVPVEYRTYGPGSSMHWHKDQPMLPDQLQYECVITLRNTSDSKTLLENKKGIKTEPNSLLVVRANGINHSVSPTTKGSRSILKVVFSEPTKRQSIPSSRSSTRRRRRRTQTA